MGGGGGQLCLAQGLFLTLAGEGEVGADPINAESHATGWEGSKVFGFFAGPTKGLFSLPSWTLLGPQQGLHDCEVWLPKDGQFCHQVLVVVIGASMGLEIRGPEI